MHGNKVLYDKLFDFSIKNKISHIIIGGDICPHIRMGLNEGINLQREFIEKFLFPYFKKLKENGIKAYIIMGNDDFGINVDLLDKADKEGLVNHIHNKSVEVNDFNLVGYSFVSELPFLLKDWEKMDNNFSKPLTKPDDDIRTVEKEEGTIEEDMEHLKKLSDTKKTIYSIHVPPFNTKLDKIGRNKHVGSVSVRLFIEKEQPLLTLHGHIHESYEISGAWKEKIGKTICINPGSDHINSVLHLVVIDLENLKDMEFFEV